MKKQIKIFIVDTGNDLQHINDEVYEINKFLGLHEVIDITSISSGGQSISVVVTYLQQETNFNNFKREQAESYSNLNNNIINQIY